MTAHVAIRDYGRIVRLVCKECDLVEDHGTRGREAEVARAKEDR